MSWFSATPSKTKVRICFKSGNFIDVRVTKMTVSKTADNRISGLEWKDMEPSALYFCLDNIEAIIELE